MLLLHANGTYDMLSHVIIRARNSSKNTVQGHVL